MPWYFYLAFKQLFPTGKRLSFFALMAIVGVMLGVMVLLVVQTVMNGFGEQLRSTVRDVGGDIRIESRGIMRDWDETLEALEAYDFIEAAAPHADGVVMMQHQNRPAFPGVRGIEYELEDKVVPLNEYMILGDLEELDDETVILGSGLARSIGASVGSTVEVYTPLMLERMKKNEILLPRELDVVGILETKYNPIDSNMILVSLRLMQELYGLGDGINGISAKLKPDIDPDVAAATIRADLQPKGLIVKSWMDAHEGYLFVLKMEKTMMFFIILFVILVASFSIASSLMTSVVRKIREIGLIGAMGGRSRHIAACFCVQGLFIGIVGAILGCLGGVLAIEFRNQIVGTFASITQSEATLVKFYQFSEVPAHYLFSDFVIIIICSVTIATLAGLLPAMKAARLKPAEALRNE